MKERYLIWINCYGAWDPQTRSKIETTGYDSYLNNVVSSIAALDGEITIYLSGGMLDQKGLTECQTTGPELEKRLKKAGVYQKINYDEDSLTSISIVRKFINTWQENYSDCTPVLFCDLVRYEINLFVLKEILKQKNISQLDPDKVVTAFERLDDHPHSTPEKQHEKLLLLQKHGIDKIEQEGKAIRIDSNERIRSNHRSDSE